VQPVGLGIGLNEGLCPYKQKMLEWDKNQLILPKREQQKKFLKLAPDNS
jgi:hypothetical protein